MPGVRGKRKDGRNLVAEWQALNPDGAFVHDIRQFEAARGKSPVLGLFELSHMQYEHDRDRGPEGEPDLEAMNQIGRTHVRTPVTNAQLVCPHLLETKKHILT